MYDKKEIGKRIKRIRINSGKTQEQFGKIFSASKGNVAMWEKGATLPNVDRLNLISDYANISVNELLYGQKITLESLKEMQLENQSALKNIIYTTVADFLNRYYDVEDNIYFKLNPADVNYFKRLFGRLELQEEINSDNSVTDESVLNSLSQKFSSLIFKDISEINTNKYDSRIRYLEDLSLYMSFGEEYSEHIFKYLIFLCERIGKTNIENLKFMLHRHVEQLVSNINDTVYDYDSDYNKDDFYKIYNNITKNNFLVNEKSLVKSINHDDYIHMIQKVNNLSSTIDNLKDAGDTHDT
ncbi:TPA: helix-turn-helix transcriptional regulator [Staphylococcus pseudintermedius]|nr:helix-turn-helix transcriptional regulator [Staphylococcus pseudintermedius]HDT9061748.1 helix-turn-helix transcriptional regulator [Staphylococcus pseudintermedius]